jgi:hypothetical protein
LIQLNSCIMNQQAAPSGSCLDTTPRRREYRPSP